MYPARVYNQGDKHLIIPLSLCNLVRLHTFTGFIVTYSLGSITASIIKLTRCWWGCHSVECRVFTFNTYKVCNTTASTITTHLQPTLPSSGDKSEFSLINNKLDWWQNIRRQWVSHCMYLNFTNTYIWICEFHKISNSQYKWPVQPKLYIVNHTQDWALGNCW